MQVRCDAGTQVCGGHRELGRPPLAELAGRNHLCGRLLLYHLNDGAGLQQAGGPGDIWHLPAVRLPHPLRLHAAAAAGPAVRGGAGLVRRSHRGLGADEPGRVLFCAAGAAGGVLSRG